MDPLFELIETHAKLSGLDPALLYAIITQESQWDAYAVRYEPEWRYVLNPDFYAKKLRITLATEIHMQSMSYGLSQLMGSVVRELGFPGPMGLLFNPDMNIKYLSLKIVEIQKRAKAPDAIFSCYNGGPGSMLKINGMYPNQSYVDSCLNYYKEYKNERLTQSGTSGAKT